MGILFAAFIMKWHLLPPLSLSKPGTTERGWCGMYRKPRWTRHELPGARLLPQQSCRKASSRPEAFTPDPRQGKHLRGRPGPGRLWTQTWADSGSTQDGLVGLISADVITSNARPLRNANSLRGDTERDGKSIKNINRTESKPCHMYPPVPSEMRIHYLPSVLCNLI